MKIIFLRHGQTDLNSQKKYQGSLDYPLNDCGIEQTLKVAKAVANDASVRDCIYQSSPLLRARQSMRIFRATLRLPSHEFQICDNLRERDCGSWEGYSAEEVASTFPENYRAYRKNKWFVKPHGGESIADVLARVSQWLATVRKPTFIVSHQAVAWALFLAVRNTSIEETLSLNIPHDKILVIEDT